ncbi:MAG: peptide-methionine (S)-S-oxide reductase MsrA [Pseudomonadota bacterium]
MFLTKMLANKTNMVSAEKALPGRDEALEIAQHHHVNGESVRGPYPEGFETIYFGMGCFWGAERLFWQTPGVHVTAVGYAGGYTKNPTYRETCTGQTGHAEVVMVVYDPESVSLGELLRIFFEEHDPTQGMRQGNDVGTVYRSAIYTTTDEQLAVVKMVRDDYAKALKSSGRGSVTTEIKPLDSCYFAEDYHQQYLSKNPGGYCGLQGTGVSCPIPQAQKAASQA